MYKFNCVYSLLIVVLLAYVVAACSDNRPTPKSENYLKGELVAQRICGSCHQYTPPELLNRIAWPNVLSAMKLEMKKMGQDPEFKDWITVQKFYLSESPQFLPGESLAQPDEQSLFSFMEWKSDSLYHSRSTLVDIDEENEMIVIGQQNGELVKYTAPGQSVSFTFPNVPIARIGRYILGMGTLAPSDDLSGSLYVEEGESFISLIKGMNRVIDFKSGDLNGNNEYEFIFSSFGSPNSRHRTGGLFSAKKKDPSSYELIALDTMTGASLSMVYDLNNDGLDDILALFSQGNEMVKAYYNQGDLKFKAQVLITFPPVYGSNSFDLSDMDDDGDIDILVTSGDNDDYSQVRKPYHGVRIFLNDGMNNFREAYFYSVNGASKVMSADFDDDGDMDFVILAMYADLFSRPWETLQYFENKGNLRFDPQYFESTPSDNWMVMDVGDVDGDGDIDILTGANQGIGVRSFIPTNLVESWRTSPQGIKVWENQTN